MEFDALINEYNETETTKPKSGKVGTTTINKLCLVKRGFVFIVCRTGMQYFLVSGCIQIFAAFSRIAFIFVVSNKFQKPLVSGLPARNARPLVQLNHPHTRGTQKHDDAKHLFSIRKCYTH